MFRRPGLDQPKTVPFIVQVAHVRGTQTVPFIVQVARVRGTTQTVLFIVQGAHIRGPQTLLSPSHLGVHARDSPG